MTAQVQVQTPRPLGKPPEWLGGDEPQPDWAKTWTEDEPPVRRLRVLWREDECLRNDPDSEGLRPNPTSVVLRSRPGAWARLFGEPFPGEENALDSWDGGDCFYYLFEHGRIAFHSYDGEGIEVPVEAPKEVNEAEKLVLPELRSWVWPWTKEWQREGVCAAVSRGDHMFVWPCGSGKTLGAIMWALAYPEPVLTLCRASVRLQWAGQIRRFTTCEPFVILPDSEKKKKGAPTLMQYLRRCHRKGLRPWVLLGWPSLAEEWKHDGDPLGISHIIGEDVAGLNRDVEQFIREVGTPQVIWDESHTAKDHRRWKAHPTQDGGKRYEKLATTAATAGFLAPRAIRRLCLTATPQPDRRRDWWSQLDIMRPGVAGAFWSKPENGVIGFAELYCAAFEDTYGWNTKGASDKEGLLELIKPWVHEVTTSRVKKEMPPLRRETTFLPPESLRTASAEARANLRNARKSKDPEAILRATMEAMATQKDKVVVEIVKDVIASGQKVVLFTELRSHSERLRHELLKALGKEFPVKGGKGKGEGHGIPWKLWHGHGGDSPSAREVIRDEFMSWQQAGVLVGTGDAWGESADLHDIDRLIHVTLPWTWGKLRQRSGRGWRLGGRPLLEQFLICAGTIEEHIAGVVMSKLATQVVSGEQMTEFRETLQGGSDDEVLDGLMDRLMED